MKAPRAHLAIDRIQCPIAQPDIAQERPKGPGRRRRTEVCLDDVREGLPVVFAAREEGVGLEVNRDRLDGHALIMHLP